MSNKRLEDNPQKFAEEFCSTFVNIVNLLEKMENVSIVLEYKQ